jgi:8-hydroxy-5-deazaflavin:NADPH oxidoreductase
VSPTPTSQDQVLGTRVGILGGTGPQGRGLARRLAGAGLDVLIGSRIPERAAEVAISLGSAVQGGSNAEVAEGADVVIVAVPWKGHAELLCELASALAGKVVVDCVNPLGFDSKGPFAISVPEGSAAEQAATLLPQSRVTAAFHHVSAEVLEDLSIPHVDVDVLVLGDDRDACDLVASIADRIPGMRGVYAGRLRNARQVEALTANLIAINKRYQTHAGIRVVGV